MRNLWWTLPGPARFVSEIADSLQNGENVVLRLPEHCPYGLSSAIHAILPDQEHWPWRILEVSENQDIDPIDFLFSRFVPNIEPDAIRSIGRLVCESGFMGQVIWLEGISAQSWRVWKEFLNEYAHVCRTRPIIQRTLFCVPLVGVLALDPPIQEVCLTHHCWQGIVNRFDILLFTTSLFLDRPIPLLLRDILIAITANLALWDPAVSMRFATEEASSILNPMPLLDQIAQSRRWTVGGMCNQDNAWAEGKADQIDGQWKNHSAWLAPIARDKEINHRVWSAQVGVVFPFVEEQRQRIVAELGRSLRVPFTTRTGEIINDWRDLEIGHIESQINNHPIKVPPKMRQLIAVLRDIRNCLSHQEMITPNLILDSNLCDSDFGRFSGT